MQPDSDVTIPQRRSRVLIVTNDFPPRRGGIETFGAALADRFDPRDVVVDTSREVGSHLHDSTLPYPVIRDRVRMMLPTAKVRQTAAPREAARNVKPLTA